MKKQKQKQIATVDMEEAHYLGIEGTGVYFDTGKGPDGLWYVSTVYDVGHDCGPMTTDDGPYATESLALLAGLEQATEVMYTNEIFRGWHTDYENLRWQFLKMDYPARYGRIPCRVLRRDEKWNWPKTMLEIECLTRKGASGGTKTVRMVNARSVKV